MERLGGWRERGKMVEGNWIGGNVVRGGWKVKNGMERNGKDGLKESVKMVERN